MSGKHTPGPWVIIPARPYDGDDQRLEGSFEAFAGIEGADGSPVCVFGDASGSATMFENERDYHLIAAAPELLAAAKECLPLNIALNNPNVPDTMVVPMDATMGELRRLAAAIAKATGEQA
jgi:hypothetical protein